jgi:AcrR family transcriptional regulator
VVKQERAERTRETIIRAAASIFEEDGYTAAPLSGITRRATVTKGALYFHFSSKRELAQAVVREAADTLQVLLGDARRLRGRQLPLQVLIDLSHAVVGRLAADPVLRAGLRLGTDADLFPERGGLALDWDGLVDELLRKPGGEPAEQIQPGSRSTPLASVLTGLELLFRRQPAQIEQETLTSVWRLLLPGLARTGEAATYEPAGSIARRGADRPPH